MSCGAYTRTVMGTTENTLLKTVAIEQNCQADNVKIIEKVKGFHGATYALDVCGKRVVYKQVGTVFMEASQADKLLNK